MPGGDVTTVHRYAAVGDRVDLMFQPAIHGRSEFLKSARHLIRQRAFHSQMKFGCLWWREALPDRSADQVDAALTEHLLCLGRNHRKRSRPIEDEKAIRDAIENSLVLAMLRTQLSLDDPESNCPSGCNDKRYDEQVEV
jgi:hypothetical protein